jgi:S-adenosylmethionine:tRNA-ribosyltransferase-isomerase (queuine synthetase)
VQDGMPGTDPLAARNMMLAAYRSALASGFRFYSFGDAMLIV